MDRVYFEVGGFLLTFAVHSTALLLVAMGLRRWLAKSDHLAETVWRFAMFGGLFTALAQRWLGVPAFRELDFVAARSAAVPGKGENLEDVAGVASTGGTAAAPAGVPDVPEQAFSMFADWALWLPFAISAYALVVLGLAAVRVRASWRFRRHVADRVEIRDPSVLLSLVTLQRAAGVFGSVRLSSSARLRSPVAFGLLRREICVPEAVLQTMTAEQRDCILAHEMAHLRAADPAWQWLYEVWTCAFAFQPLFSRARRELGVLAEYRCDGWVVAQTGDRVGMANTLVEVAEWMSGRKDPIAAPAMAHGDSSLASRVERILEAAATGEHRLQWRARLLASLVLAAASCGIPGVRLLPSPADVAGTAPASLQQELIALEGEIADLHTSLGETWRLLGGRDLPEVTETLQAMQRRLERMTEDRRELWREATSRAPNPK